MPASGNFILKWHSLVNTPNATDLIKKRYAAGKAKPALLSNVTNFNTSRQTCKAFKGLHGYGKELLGWICPFAFEKRGCGHVPHSTSLSNAFTYIFCIVSKSANAFLNRKAFLGCHRNRIITLFMCRYRNTNTDGIAGKAMRNCRFWVWHKNEIHD